MLKPLARDPVAALQQGDERALKYLFDQYNKSLVYYAISLIGQAQEAEEIVSECFNKLWQHRERLKTPVNIKAYLYAIVRNDCFNYLLLKKRTRKKNEQLTSVLQQQDILTLETETELLERIYRQAQQLPGRCKCVFLLFYKEGKTKTEIACQLGITVKTVRNYISRAKQLLIIELSRRRFSLR